MCPSPRETPWQPDWNIQTMGLAVCQVAKQNPSKLKIGALSHNLEYINQNKVKEKAFRAEISSPVSLLIHRINTTTHKTANSPAMAEEQMKSFTSLLFNQPDAEPVCCFDSSTEHPSVYLSVLSLVSYCLFPALIFILLWFSPLSSTFTFLSSLSILFPLIWFNWLLQTSPFTLLSSLADHFVLLSSFLSSLSITAYPFASLLIQHTALSALWGALLWLQRWKKKDRAVMWDQILLTLNHQLLLNIN